MNADKKKQETHELKMQMKMIIRLFVDILKTTWEVVENSYTRDPKKTGKPLILGWLLQRNFLGKAVRRWRRARAILSNLGRIEGEEDAEISSDEDSDNDEGDLGNDESDDNEQESNCVIDQSRNAVRFKGKQERSAGSCFPRGAAGSSVGDPSGQK